MCHYNEMYWKTYQSDQTNRPKSQTGQTVNDRYWVIFAKMTQYCYSTDCLCTPDVRTVLISVHVHCR